MSTSSPDRARAGPIVVLAYATASAVGSALLFSIQPMIGKAYLPLLGGSPAVWITCSACFQAGLLLGYLYAHESSRRLEIRSQAVVQVGLLALGLIASIWIGGGPRSAPASGSDPAIWLIGRLLGTVALPFVAASASTPMLQRWFSTTGHRSAPEPFFLYGASNLGGLLGLLVYPIAIEPNLSLPSQARLWSAIYTLLIALTAACALWTRRGGSATGAEVEIRTGLREALVWGSLAFLPSSLLLGLTNALTTDVAPIPLFWVVPLAIYLLTFILAFSGRPGTGRGLAARVFPWSAVALTPALALGLVQTFWIPVHLACFGAAALLCHAELARRRPGAARLSGYYLSISVGGVLGAVFNALIAPRIFDRPAEYPITIVLACMALPGVAEEFRALVGRPRRIILPAIVLLLAAPAAADPDGWGGSAPGMIGLMVACGVAALIVVEHRSRPLRFALGLGAVLIAGGIWPGKGGPTLLRERSFFGTIRVAQDDRLRFRELFHGSTLHGLQSIDPARRREALSYYHRSGPIGRVFGVLATRPGRPIHRVAVAGLGIGGVAAYAESGQEWIFYELDPDVARIADDPRSFTYLRDARERARSVSVILGDARLRLREAPEAALDLILLDAFSSDAVPVHLLTREALGLYRSKLAPGGWIVFNITNRYVDLEPVLGALAADAGLASRVVYDVRVPRREIDAGKQPSIWFVMADRESDLGSIVGDPGWKRPRVRPGKAPWSDDFSDLASCLIFGPIDRRAGR